MADFWYSFKSCGTPSFFILLLAMGGFIAAIAAIVIVLVEKTGRFAMVVALGALVIGAASLATGALGQMLGRSRTDEAIAMFSASPTLGQPDVVDRIREEGYAESANCMMLGTYGGALPLLSGAIGLVVFFLRKRSGDPSQSSTE